MAGAVALFLVAGSQVSLVCVGGVVVPVLSGVYVLIVLLALALLQGEIREGDSVRVDVSDGELTLEKVGAEAEIICKVGLRSSRPQLQVLRNQIVGGRCNVASSGPRLVAVARIKMSCGSALAYSPAD